MNSRELTNLQKKCWEDMLKAKKNYYDNKHKNREIGIQEKMKREKQLNKNIRKIQEEIEE